MKEFTNIFTGEVQKREFATPIWKPKSDLEEFEPGTSLTAPDQVETVQKIVKRCMRGEMLPGGVTKPAVYDGDSDFSPMDALNDPSTDLADIPALQASAQADMTASQEAVAEQNKPTTTDSETQSNESSES